MTSMLAKLREATPDLAPSTMSIADWQGGATERFDKPRARPGVEVSDELRRVIALPRREAVDLDGSSTALALVELMNERLARVNPKCKCAEMGRPCIRSLLPAQAWALYEAPLCNGLLAPIGAGHGKTGIGILMPMVMKDCKLAVLLIPPGLRQQFVADYLAWREHFIVPSVVIEGRGFITPGRPVLHVVPYSRFSRPDSTNLLADLKPDLIMADEAHKLRYANTATTGRVLRYFVNEPETRLTCWSGTLTAKSIKDYAHLAAIALREGSPLPIDPQIVEEWALAIDPSDWPAPAGELRRLCRREETLHQGFHRRLVETRGVTATKASAIGAAINFYERKAPEIPAKIQKMIADLRDGWVRPDGEELVEILEVARNARELACGFYHRWKFPRGETPEQIEAWFAARKAWNKELRAKLQKREEHLDSPFLCTQAAVRHYRGYEGDLPTWDAETWPAWSAVKDTVRPEPDAVWVDDFLAADAAAWLHKHKGVVWYEHVPFGRRVSELAGLPMFGGGQEEELLAEKGNRSIVVSIKAHGTGRDGLQRLFREQLVANPPASGDLWEQLLARLHRIGQSADEVDTHVYRHTPEMIDAVDRAIVQAKYIEGTMGTLQRLLLANVTWTLARS